MIVAALTLDRLDNDSCDIDPAILHELHDFGFGFLLPGDDIGVTRLFFA